MKSAKLMIVSGTFALLVTFAFTPHLHAKPAGYTSDGQPYYRAYPDEGYAPEPSYAMPPEGSFYSTYSDPNAMQEPNLDYSNWPWGWWGWSGGGWGWDNNNNFGFDSMRHHNFNRFHNRFFNNPALVNNRSINNRNINRSFVGKSAIIGHQNVGARSGHIAMGGRGGHGGGHR